MGGTADGSVTANTDLVVLVVVLLPLIFLRALFAMVRPLAARLAQAVRPRRVPQSHPRFHQQRFASSTPNAEELQKKAQDTLASVQKGLGQALATGQKLLGPVGEKAATMLGCTCLLSCVSCTPSPSSKLSYSRTCTAV